MRVGRSVEGFWKCRNAFVTKGFYLRGVPVKCRNQGFGSWEKSETLMK